TIIFLYSSSTYDPPPALPSFPTRRSSDLDPGDYRGPGSAQANGNLSAWFSAPRAGPRPAASARPAGRARPWPRGPSRARPRAARSEEHTSELQSRENLVCRLLLEKKNKHD